MTTARWLGKLPHHDRFDYQPITRRPDYVWPNGARLAVYLGFNLEHFAFGDDSVRASGRPRPNPMCSTTAGVSTAIASVPGAV